MNIIQEAVIEARNLEHALAELVQAYQDKYGLVVYSVVYNSPANHYAATGPTFDIELTVPRR